jgi:hypothetical protein
LILLGGLPMVDVLAIVGMLRRPGRRSTDGFLLRGCLALCLYLGIAAMFPEAIRDGLIGVVNRVIPLGRPNIITAFCRISLGVLMVLGFQIGVAALLAGPLDRLRRGIAARASSGPKPPA